MPIHTVQQGDYLSKIAADHGFASHLPIWNHGQNADLKQLRKNPEVLYPGDQVFVPEKETKVESRGTEVRHKFRALKETLKLRLTVLDMSQQPVANKPCQLTVDGTVYNLTTDGTGLVEQEVPRQATTGRLVMDDDTVPIHLDVKLLIGHLDPATEKSGQIGRLENLGYHTGSGGPDEERLFKRAVEEFQCDHHLAVDGICGPQTQAALERVHGS